MKENNTSNFPYKRGDLVVFRNTENQEKPEVYVVIKQQTSGALDIQPQRITGSGCDSNMSMPVDSLMTIAKWHTLRIAWLEDALGNIKTMSTHDLLDIRSIGAIQ